MWMKIRMRTEGENFNAVVNNIKSFPARVNATYFPIFQEIAEEGAQLMREIIENSVTATGLAREKAGEGEAGRIRTGRMLKNVGVTTRQLKRGGYSMSVGWRHGMPGYAIFQEHGTKGGQKGGPREGETNKQGTKITGVPAMNALGQANAYMEARVRAIKGSKPPIVRSVDFNWDNYGIGWTEDEE